jgi:hypothetical protein
VRASLTPIETGATQDPSRATAAGHHSIEINADPAEELDTDIGNQSSIARQLHATAPDQRVRERHTEAAGEMVVASPRRPQRSISWPDNSRLSR